MTRYASAGDDVATADVFNPDSSKLYATGTGAGGMLTRTYSASTGSVVWSQNYSYGSNEGKAIALSPDGTKVYVTGQSLVGGHYDYVTIAYNAVTGSRLWFQRFDSTSHLDDIPAALAVSPDGSTVFVTGSSASTSTGNDYATVAYDASTGARLWVMRFNWANLDDAATAIGVSTDSSKVFVTGSSVGSAHGSDYATLAYDASTGARLWLSRFDGPASSDDFAHALAVSANGARVFVSGYTAEPAASGYYQAATVAYNATNGSAVWSKLDGHAVVRSTQYGTTLGLSPDGTHVFVASTGTNSGSHAYVTTALTATAGALAWEQYYSGDGGHADSAANAIAVAPDGRVFVTGASADTSNLHVDIATLGFDSAGHFLFGPHPPRYNGPANGDDRGNAIAVSPDGTKLAVVGSSAGSGTGLDWIAIMYSTS